MCTRHVICMCIGWSATPSPGWREILIDCPDPSCGLVFNQTDYLPYLALRWKPLTQESLMRRRFVSFEYICRVFKFSCEIGSQRTIDHCRMQERFNESSCLLVVRLLFKSVIPLVCPQNTKLMYIYNVQFNVIPMTGHWDRCHKARTPLFFIQGVQLATGHQWVF